MEKRCVCSCYLVARRQVGYLPHGDVDHHHHVGAVEDVGRVPAGENVLQELEHRVRRRWGVFEHAHGVVWGGRRMRLLQHTGPEHNDTTPAAAGGGMVRDVTASVEEQKNLLSQNLDVLLLQLLHDDVVAGRCRTRRRLYQATPNLQNICCCGYISYLLLH